jgi:hypothetical protein
MTEEPTRTFDQALLSVWQEQLKGILIPLRKIRTVRKNS